MDNVYKSQLQSFAMKKNMDLPIYSAERQGPAHSPEFRCNVTVCGQTFQCQEFFPTLRAAEHAAAKIALTSLNQSNPEGVDVAYKNLLQEIAQKNNSDLPVYATATSGPSHLPTFTSTVEFAGKVFTGEEAKTKKLAEMSAAKVAFMSFKHGQPNQISSTSMSCERQEAANSNVTSSVQATPSQTSKMVTPDVPSKWIEVYEDEVLVAPANGVKEMNIAASPVATHPTNDDASLTAPATKDMEMDTVAASSAVPQNPAKEGNDSSTSSSCGEDSEKKFIMGTGHKSTLTGQHVVCRPWNPEVTLPQDAEMLFRDDRFIAYRLLKP